MSDFSLEQILEGIESEIQVDADGKGSATIRGAARICGVTDSALVRHFSGADKNPSKLAQMLMEQGFSPSLFGSFGIPDVALVLIVEYYTFDAGQRCTEEARQCLRLFSGVGIRFWLHQAKGLVPKSVKAALPPVKDVSEKGGSLFIPGVTGDDPGYVYVVGSPDLPYVKIGKSRSPLSRLSSLQCASPYRLEVLRLYKTGGMTGMENHLHRTFRKHRASGEWFIRTAVIEGFWEGTELVNLDLIMAMADERGVFCA